MMHISRKIAGPLLLCAGCAAGCGASAKPDSLGNDAGDVGHTPGTPGLGVHGLKYYKYRAGSPSTISVPMSTQVSGSTIVLSVGRGDKTKFVLPTDNKDNTPYVEQGTVHAYDPYFPNSGTAVYSFTSARGGADFSLTTTTDPADEITVAAVEVIEGTKVQDVQWIELPGAPLTSKSVTTTGPATLIAFWWGDGSTPDTPQTAKADSGFTVVDTNAQELNGFVQCAVAVKNVAQAGTYNVTWTATPAQGAQMWLIAVQ